MFNSNLNRSVALVIFATVALLFMANTLHKRATVVNMLNSADTLINSNPSQALELIRDVDINLFTGSANRARYSLLHSKILDKNYIDVTTDSIINYAVKYYSSKGSNAQKAEMYYYRGILYYNLDDKDKTIEYMVNAKSFAKEIEDNYLKGLISNTLGNIYFKEGSFESAIEEYMGSVEYFGLCKEEYKVANAYAYIAKCYNLLKESSLAIEYYEIAREGYLNIERIDKATLVNGALASIYIRNNEFNRAAECLLDWYKQYNDNLIPEKDYALWARIYLGRGEYSNAKRYALDLINLKTLTLRERAGALSILVDIEVYNRDYKEAMNYYKEFSDLGLENYEREKRAFVSSATDKYNKQRQQDAYDALQLKSYYQRLLYFIVIIALLLIATALIVRLIKKRDALRASLERERRESSLLAEEMQGEIELIKEQYNLVLEELKESGEGSHLFTAFERRMNQLKELMETAYTSESDPTLFYNKFTSYMTLTNESQNNFSDIRYLVDKKYNGIIEYITKRHPNLTEQEIDLFSMLCFGFTSNVIRLIYGHKNLDSVFTKRKRLRANLELKENVKLESYIKSLKLELAEGKIG